MGDGILLKPKKPFQETNLKYVAGCLQYNCKAKTLEEMDDALSQSLLKKIHQLLLS